MNLATTPVDTSTAGDVGVGIWIGLSIVLIVFLVALYFGVVKFRRKK